jgi:hypothetical protein
VRGGQKWLPNGSIADELRHHDPFGLPELLLAHEGMLHRLRAA